MTPRFSTPSPTDGDVKADSPTGSEKFLAPSLASLSPTRGGTPVVASAAPWSHQLLAARGTTSPLQGLRMSSIPYLGGSVAMLHRGIPAVGSESHRPTPPIPNTITNPNGFASMGGGAAINGELSTGRGAAINASQGLTASGFAGAIGGIASRITGTTVGGGLAARQSVMTSGMAGGGMTGLDAARRAAERGMRASLPVTGLVSGFDGHGSSLGSSFDGLHEEANEEEISHASTLGYAELGSEEGAAADDDDDAQSGGEEDFNHWFAEGDF